MGVLRDLIRDRVTTPLISYARSGAPPRVLARSVGAGFALGVCPVLLAPLPLCAAALALGHAVAPGFFHGGALLLGNLVSAPVEVRVRARRASTAVACPPPPPGSHARHPLHHPILSSCSCSPTSAWGSG